MDQIILEKARIFFKDGKLSFRADSREAVEKLSNLYELLTQGFDRLPVYDRKGGSLIRIFSLAEDGESFFLAALAWELRRYGFTATLEGAKPKKRFADLQKMIRRESGKRKKSSPADDDFEYLLENAKGKREQGVNLP